MRKLFSTLTIAAALTMFTMAMATPAEAGSLPDNCSKDRGKVTCTTTTQTKPGKNKGGVTDTTTTTTTSRGNLTNKQTSTSTKCRETKGNTRC